MEGTVEKRTVSKKGNPVLTISGQAYTVSPQSGLDVSNIQIGDKLSFEGHSYLFQNKTYWSLDSYKLISAALKYEALKYPANGQQLQPGNLSQPQATVAITEGERLTLSNWVAAVAGRSDSPIKEPADLGIWARAALEALRFAGKDLK